MLGLALLASLQQQARPAAPDNSYLFFVASEGSDQVALVRFGPTGARIEHRTPIKLPLIDSAGPGAVHVGPGGQFYYVTTAHGFPSGELLKVRIAADSAPMLRLGSDSARGGPPADTLRGREPLGAFPGTVQVTPDGEYAWVMNSPPDGQWQPSWVSVVYLAPMVEVMRIPICSGPRGGRLTADGTRYYAVCVPEGELVEIDVKGMQVARRLALPSAGAQRCGASAVTVSADQSRLYIACQQSNDVIEVDARTWSVTQRIAVGAAPADLALTRDGRILVVANRESQNVSLVDMAGGRELARLFTPRHVPAGMVIIPEDRGLFVRVAGLIATARRLPAGVIISPDDRYAFVSVTGRGEDLGTVEIIDLAARAIVATVDVGSGARGLDFWKTELRRNPN